MPPGHHPHRELGPLIARDSEEALCVLSRLLLSSLSINNSLSPAKLVLKIETWYATTTSRSVLNHQPLQWLSLLSLISDQKTSTLRRVILILGTPLSPLIEPAFRMTETRPSHGKTYSLN